MKVTHPIIRKASMLKHRIAGLVILACGLAAPVQAQPFPGEDENIPFLITFGKAGSKSWGDDDFSQTFFFSVPKDRKDPIYIRVFDPDCGGKHDENKGGFDTETRFGVYGGKGAISHPDSKGFGPEGEYLSGTLLNAKTFGVNEKYDDQWYTFGPFNPTEGEWHEKANGYVFKVVCDGMSGDDGNTYRYYLSSQQSNNVKVEGANGFTYEYTFRLPNERSICHIYPFVDDQVISIQQHNFDWDADGTIRMVSVARKGEPVSQSTDNDWALSKHLIDTREKNTSLDIQFIKTGTAHNNNVVVRVQNQYGESLPFYSIPIGGKPVYKPQINVAPQPKPK